MMLLSVFIRIIMLSDMLLCVVVKFVEGMMSLLGIGGNMFFSIISSRMLR